MPELGLARHPHSAALLPAGFAAVTVAGQIAYPLVHGSARARLTVAIVLVFALASVSHALLTRGPALASGLLLTTAGIGYAAEVIGVHTGYPFGQYHYRAGLGPRVADVPIVIALAWTMFAWPAAIVARTLVRSYPARVVAGAWALASWDLFLDPQLVAAGRWQWQFPSPHLPGVADVPLTNYAGWLAVSVLISLVLQGFPDRGGHDERVPLALYLWTWLSSVLALAAFLDRPAAAAWGGLGMALVAVPLVRALALRARPVPR